MEQPFYHVWLVQKQLNLAINYLIVFRFSNIYFKLLNDQADGT